MKISVGSMDGKLRRQRGRVLTGFARACRGVPSVASISTCRSCSTRVTCAPSSSEKAPTAPSPPRTARPVKACVNTAVHSRSICISPGQVRALCARNCRGGGRRGSASWCQATVTKQACARSTPMRKFNISLYKCTHLCQLARRLRTGTVCDRKQPRARPPGWRRRWRHRRGRGTLRRRRRHGPRGNGEKGGGGCGKSRSHASAILASRAHSWRSAGGGWTGVQRRALGARAVECARLSGMNNEGEIPCETGHLT